MSSRHFIAARPTTIGSMRQQCHVHRRILLQIAIFLCGSNASSAGIFDAADALQSAMLASTDLSYFPVFIRAASSTMASRRLRHAIGTYHHRQDQIAFNTKPNGRGVFDIISRAEIAGFEVMRHPRVGHRTITAIATMTL